VDFGAPAEQVSAALAALPGVGAWTAQYVALRALGEPDAFPAGDLVLRRVAGAGSAPLTARALEVRSEAWRPWRGYAVMHLWCAAAHAARPSAADRARSRRGAARRRA
jgi:AraC family transcriptional regulator of adaptative response / DNA-3-methyladenine glycosylase II